MLKQRNSKNGTPKIPIVGERCAEVARRAAVALGHGYTGVLPGRIYGNAAEKSVQARKFGEFTPARRLDGTVGAWENGACLTARSGEGGVRFEW